MLCESRCDIVKKLVAWLIWPCDSCAKIKAFRLTICSERKNPPRKSTEIMTRYGVVGVKSAHAPVKSAAMISVPHQHGAEPEPCQHAGGDRAHAKHADRIDEGDEAGLERAVAELLLEEQRQHERQRADADAEHRAPDQACPERRNPEKPEVEDRLRRAARVEGVADKRRRARHDARDGEKAERIAARRGVDAEEKRAQPEA